MKTHCKRGHLRSEDNLDSKRSCVLCKNERSKAWGLEHPQANKLAVIKYRATHPEKKKAINDAWKAANPEKDKAIRRAWVVSNPEAVRATWHRRKARKLEAGGSFTAQQWLALLLLYGHKCLCCGRAELELHSKNLMLVPDHVVPLCDGGTNDISNIQPLCHSLVLGSLGGCNNRKGRKTIDFRN